jgi:hypothetical protein
MLSTSDTKLRLREGAMCSLLVHKPIKLSEWFDQTIPTAVASTSASSSQNKIFQIAIAWPLVNIYAYKKFLISRSPASSQSFFVAHAHTPTHDGEKRASTLGSSGRGQVATNVRSNESHPRNMPSKKVAFATSHLETSELKLVQP